MSTLPHSPTLGTPPVLEMGSFSGTFFCWRQGGSNNRICREYTSGEKTSGKSKSVQPTGGGRGSNAGPLVVAVERAYAREGALDLLNGGLQMYPANQYLSFRMPRLADNGLTPGFH